MRALTVLPSVALLLVLATAAAPAPAATRSAPPACGHADRSLPHWARQRSMTVVNDSVLLSGEAALRRGMPCWRIDLIGMPALMIGRAAEAIRSSGRRVAPLAVVGLGYNSLWERGRRHHARWAARFDAEAARLVRALRHAGAEQIVWVTLQTGHPRDDGRGAAGASSASTRGTSPTSTSGCARWTPSAPASSWPTGAWRAPATTSPTTRSTSTSAAAG